jgi:hypothetical protein
MFLDSFLQIEYLLGNGNFIFRTCCFLQHRILERASIALSVHQNDRQHGQLKSTKREVHPFLSKCKTAWLLLVFAALLFGFLPFLCFSAL